MGLCSSKERALGHPYTVTEVRHSHRKPSANEFLDIFDFKVHVVRINTAVPGSIELMFMNEAAIRMYGNITGNQRWPLIQMMGEKNIGLMIDAVVNRNRTWKCISSDDSGVQSYSARPSADEGSQSSTDALDSPMHIYPQHTQIQRALVALQQQRKSIQIQRRSQQSSRSRSTCMNGGNGRDGRDGNTNSNSTHQHTNTHQSQGMLQHKPISITNKTWYEIRCYPHIYEGQNAILVTQYNVTKHVQRNTALMRMADNHLRVLQQVYPRHFISDSPDGEALMEHSDFGRFADHHDSVIVMFADIVGFTSMCKVVTPEQVMQFLLLLYQEFDKLVASFPDLFKYEIAGDCYIVVGGLVNRDTNGFSARRVMTKSEMRKLAVHMMKFSIGVQEIASSMKMPHDMTSNVMMHIGIHMGPVVSGIIGLTSPKFMLFGDTMNTASRLESTCPAGKIQVSDEFYSLLPSGSIAGGGIWQKTKGVEVKGKGLMDTWLLVSPSPASVTPVDTDEHAESALPSEN